MQAITPHEIPGAVGDEWIAPVIDLYDFCNPWSENPIATSPWSLDGHTYATNRHIMIRIPGNYASPITPRLLACITNINNLLNTVGLEWHPLETLSLDWSAVPEYTRSIVCGACNGTGKATRKHCPDCLKKEPNPDADPYNNLCPLCSNTGFALVPHDHNDCPECEGIGRFYPAYSTPIIDPLFNGLGFQSHYLRLFVHQFTNIEFAVNKSTDTLHLRFDEGVGAVKALRDFTTLEAIGIKAMGGN
ncbi:MAG: hypothetical protein OIF57_16285 [Marinobacterium sp.]|nr:hypothetical protein [Marinobacterium sp.]